ncbi:hypothetical protein [Actinokineospora globicatena]|uniref:Cell division protein FtsL n=1 Tax=Actinokineospora globicatena TaxID=103729 RepID=A0A9W6V9D3_9PSEU|nr:hypothetical protein [Actinokineospora globicatena]GLW90921.1 hypothetical protein Aglo03_17370 [Actinokineospora globicatena]
MTAPPSSTGRLPTQSRPTPDDDPEAGPGAAPKADLPRARRGSVRDRNASGAGRDSTRSDEDDRGVGAEHGESVTGRAQARRTDPTPPEPGGPTQTARGLGSTTRAATRPRRTAEPRTKVSAAKSQRTGAAVTKSAAAKSATAAKSTVEASGQVGLLESTPKPRRAAQRPRTPAAERAYARRAQREGVRPHTSSAAAANEEASAGRASFVVLIIALLAVGVAATLWLTTQAIADSYDLERTKQQTTELAEQAALLQQEVTHQEAAPALAERAKALGMVPAGDSAWIRLKPDGTVEVVGTAKPATAPADPTPPTATPPAADTATPPAADGAQPGGTQPTPAQPDPAQPAGTQSPAEGTPQGTQPLSPNQPRIDPEPPGGAG